MVSVLDHGFVDLLEHFGDDSTVAKCARVSYSSGTKRKRGDSGLIHYLVRNGHTTPLEHVKFRFHIRAPLFIARQWLRHRTLCASEISGRYSIVDQEFYVPSVERLMIPDGYAKGRSGENGLSETEAAATIKQMKFLNKIIADKYTSMLRCGVPRELARIVLPMSTYTEFIFTQDLHNLFHFLKLRLGDHSQYEIRVYAQAILSLIEPVVPACTSAFDRYVLE